VLLTIACCLGGPGCRPKEAGPPEARRATTPAPAPTVDADRTSDRPRIVALGDSLTAGYGLRPEDAYPALLQKKVDEAGLAYEVVAMGVSGDTSAGGLARLDWALEGDVRVLIVALGGNDGLRGLSPRAMASNLEAVIDRARARGIAVLLCGMEAPPNAGASYTSEFRDAYRRLAREKQVAFLPFMLSGVAGVASLNQADGIHPNGDGARRVAELVWAELRPLLDETVTR
jgi:acyl-CoA thioesterase-1